MPGLTDAALAFHDAGCCVIPARNDGSKAPAVDWKPYMAARPTRDQVATWAASHDGIGLVCGAVSGQLEMFELEGRAMSTLTGLAGLLADHGLAGLWARLNAGYLERTPTGGLHWLYRVTGTARPNLKLARRPATTDELTTNPHDKVKVLVETRGEGGFTVVAPSAGRTHPTGEAWQLLAGNPATIPTISEDERDALHAVAAMLDAMPADDHTGDTPTPTTGRGNSTGDRPGDDYNQRASWEEVLTPHGWRRVKPMGHGWTWQRPGKTHGISATTGQSDDGADRLYVFSTSTEFDTGRPYSKFAAYTLLEHHGDHTAAAKTLRAAGYGTPLEPSHDTAGLISPHTGSLAPIATVHPIQDARPRLAVVDERSLERSDDGNALALVNRFGDRLRYCPQRGRWLAWDGTRWHEQPTRGGHARELAKRVARALPETDKEALRHKRYSMSAVGISNLLTSAETDDRIAVNIDELDNHPWELNTPAGILDLRTGALNPADPAKLHTRLTACAPNPDADPHYWQTFLTDTFGDNPAGQILIAYLQRLVGYSAVGVVGPHVLPFCYGSGGNGKGAFLEALQKVLGDYATTAPSGFLMATQHTKHETEIARLAGARLVLCSEVNEDDRFDEAKVKQLTGGDTLTARFMRQDHFTFTPTHQLWLIGNYKPAVRSGGRAFWRRLRLIPFLHEVPEEKVVDDIQGILAADHGPALMQWIAQGAAKYAAGGLNEPSSVKAATEDYAHDQDTVARFLEDACHVGGGPAIKLRVGEVRNAYERWCAETGETPITAKALGMALQRRGVDSIKGRQGARFYTGITLLRTDENAPPDAPPDAPPSPPADDWQTTWTGGGGA